MGTRTRTIARYVANTFSDSTNVQTLTPTSDVTFSNTTITGTANIATWTTSTILMGNVVANTTGLFPGSNGAIATLGSSGKRWNMYANVADVTGTMTVSGSVTTSGGVYPTSNTAGASLGSATQLFNLYANAINLGSASSINPASNAATGTLGSATARWGINANNITVSGNVSPLANGVSLGTTAAVWALYANNITNYGGTGVNPSSNTVGYILGTSTQRWVVNANTINLSGAITTSGAITPTTNTQTLGTSSAQWTISANNFVNYGTTGVTPSSNTVGQILGTSSQRWVLNANTGNFSANVNVTGTVWSNTTVGSSTTASISTNVLTLDLSLATLFETSLNANITTLTINNTQSSGYISNFILSFVADGTSRTVSWPASVKWPGGVAPTLTSTLNKKDIFVFFTYDGGTTWYGFTVGQNL